MYTKLLVVVVLLIPSIYYSWKEYKKLRWRHEAYKSLEKFALRAEESLNSTFTNISAILSSAFGITEMETNTIDSYIALGIHKDDAEKIMEYTIRFQYHDVKSLRTEAKAFTGYAVEALKKSNEEYKRQLPSLLCPPACAFIALIVFI